MTQYDATCHYFYMKQSYKALLLVCTLSTNLAYAKSNFDSNQYCIYEAIIEATNNLNEKILVSKLNSLSEKDKNELSLTSQIKVLSADKIAASSYGDISFKVVLQNLEETDNNLRIFEVKLDSNCRNQDVLEVTKK